MLTCKEKRKDELMQVEHSFLLILQTAHVIGKEENAFGVVNLSLPQGNFIFELKPYTKGRRSSPV